MGVQEQQRHGLEGLGQVTGRFAKMQAGEFRVETENLWRSAQAIYETIVSEVESGHITPVQGVSVIAATTGTLFGWAEFQRELRPSDLALGLIGGNGGQS